MEDEITYVDVLAMAQAVHNNGGLVILQAKRMVKAGTIHPRQVKVPGYLVDIVVINENRSSYIMVLMHSLQEIILQKKMKMHHFHWTREKSLQDVH